MGGREKVIPQTQKTPGGEPRVDCRNSSVLDLRLCRWLAGQRGRDQEMRENLSAAFGNFHLVYQNPRQVPVNVILTVARTARGKERTGQDQCAQDIRRIFNLGDTACANRNPEVQSLQADLYVVAGCPRGTPGWILLRALREGSASAELVAHSCRFWVAQAIGSSGAKERRQVIHPPNSRAKVEHLPWMGNVGWQFGHGAAWPAHVDPSRSRCKPSPGMGLVSVLKTLSLSEKTPFQAWAFSYPSRTLLADAIARSPESVDNLWISG